MLCLPMQLILSFPCCPGEMTSAREVGGTPVDTAAFILRERPDEDGNTLVTFTEQRDSKGVSDYKEY